MAHIDPRRVRAETANLVNIARRSRGVSIEALAEMIGVHDRTLLRRLSGTYGWKLDDLCLIAEALDVSIHDLIPAR